MKIGLPSIVSRNDPVDFLELHKTTYAFLDINLEKVKGGIKKQLLVEHILSFVGKNGIDAIRSLPRYREFYLEDLINQSNKKGLNLRIYANKDAKPYKLKSRDKELMVLRFICKQETNATIAKQMKLSVRTIDGYRENLLRKTKSKNTAGLVCFAIKNRIYSIEEDDILSQDCLTN